MSATGAKWSFATSIAVVALGFVGIACTDTEPDGLALYEAGRRVSLEASRSHLLGEQLMTMFNQCHLFHIVTGNDSSQDALGELWRDTERGDHVVLAVQDTAHPKFEHLRGRRFTLLLGLDAEAGVGHVLTTNDGVVSSYIKCPGGDFMELTCELLSEAVPRDSLPVCSRVDDFRSRLGEQPR